MQLSMSLSVGSAWAWHKYQQVVGMTHPQCEWVGDLLNLVEVEILKSI